MGVSNIANLAGSSFAAGSSGKIPQDVHVVDASGTPVSFGGSGGTSSTDEATFTPTTSTGTPVMGAVDETAPDAAAEGSLAIVRSTLNRALHVNLRDASGNEVSVGGGTQYTEGNTDASITGTALLFEGAGDTLVAAPGTAANGLDVDVTRVSGTVTVDGSGVTQPVSGTVTANLAAGANAIGTVGVTSVVPGTSATSLGKAEDAAHSSGDTGVMALAVRSDAGGAIAGADGDYTPLQVDSSGSLRVTGGGGGTEYTEGDTDASFTGGVVMMEGAANTAVPLQGTAADGLLVNLGANNDVTVTGTVTVGAHAVTNAGTFVVQENGTALTRLTTLAGAVYAEDIAAQAADPGVAVLAVRRDADTSLVGTDNDYAQLQVDANGRLKVEAFSGETLPVSGTVTANAGTGTMAVSNAGTFAVQAAPTSAAAWGVYVEDAAETAGGNLMMAGSVRRDTAASSAGTTGDNATINTDSVGALWTRDTATLVDDAAFTPATSRVVPVGLQADETATDSVDEGDIGAPRMTLDRKQIVTVQPHTTGGLSTFMASGSDGSSILVATARVIKASAGQLYGYYAYNPEAAVTFVHFYNVAAASVTVGTTNPMFTLAVPAGAAANLMFPCGVTFSNAGWSCAATTTAGGNTAPATGVSLVAWYM